MLVEAAVVGGNPERWRRRLEGFEQELRARRLEIDRDDPGSSRLAAIDDDRQRLRHLGAFALPIITEMAAWPAAAAWGEWLDRLDVWRHARCGRRRMCGACWPTSGRWHRSVP
jgi:hypothetical protein